MNILISRSEDAEALSAVARATFLQSFSHEIGWPDIAMRARDEDSPEGFRKRFAEDSPCWLARVEGTDAPVGFAMLCAPELPVETGVGDVELKRIYVLHRFHGTGTGARLLSAAEAHAREEGRERLLLGVKNDSPAVDWYERRGFEVVGTRQFRVGESLFDDLVMAKSL